MVLTALLIVGITVLVFIFLYFVPVNLWITAQFSGVRIGLLELVFMRVRRVPPSVVVNSLITATKAGLAIKDDVESSARVLKAPDLETHYLAGGNVPQVITALISAEKANIELHDVRWVVGSKIEDTYDTLRKDWFGSPKGLHIDSYKKIKYIDGYKICLLYTSPSPRD